MAVAKVLLSVAIIFVTWTVGLLIFICLNPRKKALYGSIVGRIWMSWVVMLEVMTIVPSLCLSFDNRFLLQWAIETLMTGFAAFTLGLVFFHLKQQFYKLCSLIKQFKRQI